MCVSITTKIGLVSVCVYYHNPRVCVCVCVHYHNPRVCVCVCVRASITTTLGFVSACERYSAHPAADL